MNGPSFRFRLERVRGLRERKEDLAKQELAGALARRLESEMRVQAAELQVAQARALQLDNVTVTRSPSDLLAAQVYLERTESAHRARLQELTNRESELVRSRDALTHAARDRQVLERLKERRRAEHDREVARQEGVRLDEIATDVFIRRAA